MPSSFDTIFSDSSFDYLPQAQATRTNYLSDSSTSFDDAFYQASDFQPNAIVQDISTMLSGHNANALSKRIASNIDLNSDEFLNDCCVVSRALKMAEISMRELLQVNASDLCTLRRAIAKNMEMNGAFFFHHDDFRLAQIMNVGRPGEMLLPTISEVEHFKAICSAIVEHLRNANNGVLRVIVILVSIAVVTFSHWKGAKMFDNCNGEKVSHRCCLAVIDAIRIWMRDVVTFCDNDETPSRFFRF